MTEIDDLHQGSIDMHVHHGPDSLLPRRVDALEAAEQAEQAGMRAIVLKNHHYPTTPLTIIISQLVPEVEVFGSICLDYEVGGLNFRALEASAELGAKIAWMPTTSSANSRARMAKAMGKTWEEEGFSILDTGGKLVPEIDGLLSLIKEHDMVLANGHISRSETFALVEAAGKKGISKLVITHPLETTLVDHPLSLEDLQQLAQMGAFIEYTFVGLLPNTHRNDPAQVAKAIELIGAEHSIIGTDLGQYPNPPPAEGMRMFISTLLKQGVTAREIEFMAKINPAKLLGLD